MWCFPLAAFKLVFFVFAFQQFVHLAMDFFEFILFGVHQLSWIGKVKFFWHFEFSAIIYSKTFSTSHSSLSETLMTDCRYLGIIPQSLRLSSFCSFQSFSSLCSDYIISTDLSSNSLTLLSSHLYYWAHQVNCLLWLLCFSIIL